MTAAFGGLGTAPAPSLPAVPVGEPYTNDQLSITVEQLLIAQSIDRGSTADPGQPVVVAVVTAVNRWDRPQLASQTVVRNLSLSEGSTPGPARDTDSTSATPASKASASTGRSDTETRGVGTAGADGTVDRSVDGVLDAADVPSVMRLDDLVLAGELQPGVPVPLALIWAIDADLARRLAGSDEMVVTISDQVLTVSEYVKTDIGWSFPTPAATVHARPIVRGSISLAELDRSTTAPEGER